MTLRAGNVVANQNGLFWCDILAGSRALESTIWKLAEIFVFIVYSTIPDHDASIYT